MRDLESSGSVFSLYVVAETRQQSGYPSLAYHEYDYVSLAPIFLNYFDMCGYDLELDDYGCE